MKRCDTTWEEHTEDHWKLSLWVVLSFASYILHVITLKSFDDETFWGWIGPFWWSAQKKCQNHWILVIFVELILPAHVTDQLRSLVIWAKQPKLWFTQSPQHNLSTRKKKEKMFSRKMLRSCFMSLWLGLACQHRISCALM